MLARQEERLWQKLWEIHQNHAAVSRIASRLEGRFAPNAAIRTLDAMIPGILSDKKNFYFALWNNFSGTVQKKDYKGIRSKKTDRKGRRILRK